MDFTHPGAVSSFAKMRLEFQGGAGLYCFKGVCDKDGYHYDFMVLFSGCGGFHLTRDLISHYYKTQTWSQLDSESSLMNLILKDGCYRKTRVDGDKMTECLGDAVNGRVTKRDYFISFIDIDNYYLG